MPARCGEPQARRAGATESRAEAAAARAKLRCMGAPFDLATPRQPHPGWGSGVKVWLMRHGEVHEDYQGLAYGGMDVPLSSEGREQTERLAERFAAAGITRVCASTLSRARVLGERLAQHCGAPLELDAGLVEIDRGRWQGLRQADLIARYEAQIAAFYADPWNWREHGGETDRDVLARAWPVLERSVRAARGPIALACHYNVVRNLIAHALGAPPTASFRIRIDLTAAALLEDTPQGWRLARCNVRSPHGGFSA